MGAVNDRRAGIHQVRRAFLRSNDQATARQQLLCTSATRFLSRAPGSAFESGVRLRVECALSALFFSRSAAIFCEIKELKAAFQTLKAHLLLDFNFVDLLSHDQLDAASTFRASAAT